MGQKVRDIMTPAPARLAATSSIIEAANAMRDGNFGCVLVEQNGKLCGIATDRDIVVRGLTQGSDPAKMRIGDVCTESLATVSPEDDAEKAVRLMREKAVRRVPVMDGDEAVGILSLGDLAEERDPTSVLGAISAAPPSH